MTHPDTERYAREAAEAARAAIGTQLNRVYWVVEHMTGLEGQDKMLTIEMSQAMLCDITDNGGLKPTVEYIKRYCDVLEGPDYEADAERIAGEI
jgi:hypothetical protein